MLVTDIDLFAAVGRYGDINAVSIQITKKENDLARLEFESRYRAAQGDRFFFGLKNGEPLSFVTTEVSNQSTVEQGTGLVMTVVLAAHISDQDLATLRDALTTKQIDAVRVALASGEVERSIDDKNGKKMLAKFGCFFRTLDAMGIDLTRGGSANKAGQVEAVSADSHAVSAQGKYVRKGNSSGDFVELKAGGMFTISSEGKTYSGDYAVKSETVRFTSSSWPQKPGVKAYQDARFSGDLITFALGNAYEKQAEPPKAGAQLTVDQVIQLVAAKVADDIIITTIQKSSSRFDLSTDDLIRLKTAAVSDAVVRAMAQHPQSS
jgi:hypothetical protein